VIFVTGATGFLGKAVVTELLQQGYQVKIFVRSTSDTTFFEQMSGVEIAIGDVLDPASIAQAIQGCCVVVHAAALFRFWGKAEIFEDTNVIGTENVLRAALDGGLRRVILISSIAVIGTPQPDTPITESTPPNPVDPYQKSKLHAERVAQRYQREFGLEVIILRLGALYGPWGHYAFNRLFFEEFLRGWRIQVERGQRITFPCYIKDAAQGVERAIRLGRSGEIYNICGTSISHKGLNYLISQQAGKSTWRINMPKWLMITTANLLELIAVLTKREPFYPLNLKVYVFQDWIVDSNKAQKELGFHPTPIEEGVRQTLAWYGSLGIV
jgi:dihydroflavonol-4-reductase